jgi:hypothetical protein
MAICSRCHTPHDRTGQRLCLRCHADYMRTWRQHHPPSAEQRRKDNARSYAGTYKRRGRLRPEPCQDCGTTESVEMHHHDYTRPLDVTWLCRSCRLARPRAAPPVATT